MTISTCFAGGVVRANPNQWNPNDGPSKEAIELIIFSEVTSKAYYNKAYVRPIWPGGASGITWGIGWDGGMRPKSAIRKEWSKNADASELKAMESVSGITGQKAKVKLSSVKYSIYIPFDDAEDVFFNHTVPIYWNMTKNTFPGIEKLHPHIQGALLSIVFNRGTSLTGSTRKEMLEMRNVISEGKPEKIPALIRASKRLWVGKGLDGLLARREKEALLVEKGLREMGLIQ